MAGEDKSLPAGSDQVPALQWALLLGTGTPPTWDGLLRMADARRAGTLAAQSARAKRKSAERRAKEELEVAKRRHKRAGQGGCGLLLDLVGLSIVRRPVDKGKKQGTKVTAVVDAGGGEARQVGQGTTGQDEPDGGNGGDQGNDGQDNSGNVSTSANEDPAGDDSNNAPNATGGGTVF